jgi:hypothetical protein
LAGSNLTVGASFIGLSCPLERLGSVVVCRNWSNYKVSSSIENSNRIYW